METHALTHFGQMLAGDNPFELDGRGDEGEGPPLPNKARVWTNDEKSEKLSGYLEVDADFWSLIRYGTHVRYVTRAGEFRTGGFVLKNPFDTKPKGGAVEKRFIKLQNGFNDKAKGYAQWIAAYEDIAKIYIKADAGVLMMMRSLETAVRSLNENVRRVVVFAKGHDSRLKALEGRK